MESGPKHGSADSVVGAFNLGTNQSGMRAHNERLVLTLVRQHVSLPKSDIARMTKLSAQTVSVIMRELEQEGLLLREDPVRGRIGQPSIPMALDPEGAFFLGLKLGRRSAELVLIDFVGKVRAMLRSSYVYPAPIETVAFVRGGIASIRADLTPEQNRRVAGLGIAMPFELWNWSDTVGAPREIMEQWRDFDIRGAIAANLDFPVYLQNDATAACGAELVFGHTGLRDFIYFYIGAFAGGGIVLNSKLYGGPTGNAGALGSMPVPGADNNKPTQLIDVASIAILEKALNARSIDGAFLWMSPEDWGDIGVELDAWIEAAGAALAYAIVSAAAVIDFEAAVIDGWMPTKVRESLVEAVKTTIATIDVEGLRVPKVRIGTVGIHARALGGASLPLSERFLVGSTALAREH